MSKDLIDRIGTDVRAIGADPAINARLSSSGLTARTNTSAEFAAIIERERAKVAAFAQHVARPWRRPGALGGVNRYGLRAPGLARLSMPSSVSTLALVPEFLQ
jgi:hypothetical protein